MITDSGKQSDLFSEFHSFIQNFWQDRQSNLPSFLHGLEDREVPHIFDKVFPLVQEQFGKVFDTLGSKLGPEFQTATQAFQGMFK